VRFWAKLEMIRYEISKRGERTLYLGAPLALEAGGGGDCAVTSAEQGAQAVNLVLVVDVDAEVVVPSSCCCCEGRRRGGGPGGGSVDEEKTVEEAGEEESGGDEEERSRLVCSTAAAGVVVPHAASSPETEI
jgi:hypothetical protein